MKQDNWKENLENFLGGTFHQDIDSPEKAIEEYISEVSNAWLKKTIQTAEIFLDSDLTTDEKNNFVQMNTDIYFPAIGKTPLQWFENMINDFKKYVSKDT